MHTSTITTNTDNDNNNNKTMSTDTYLPRNYASTNLQATLYPNSCFDFTDLLAFASRNPIDDSVPFELEPESCPSSTPCSELDEDSESETPLELTYSGGSASTSDTLSSTSTMCTDSASLLSGTASRMARSPGRGLRVVRQDQDAVIEGVIRKLGGYSLGLCNAVTVDGDGDGDLGLDYEAKSYGKEMGMIEDTTQDGQVRISRSGLMGVRPKAVSDADCMLWTRVWGSATAVKNARQRRMRRSMERKAKKDGLIEC